MTSRPPEPDFASRLLEWWQTHGRHDLPWQLERTPYRVWVAEIMLQQTQVTTAIPYFERFTARFPDLETLAGADLDQVLSLWSGLGYYARARNLHAAAKTCMKHHGGRLPDDPDALEALPGIGRSTANAIAAQAFGRRAPILDGNVKRVLARHAGIPGWPGKTAVAGKLWHEAERRTPPDRAADYTQAIMDLGATLCTPRDPDCNHCPVAGDCVALATGRVAELPGRRPRRRRPKRRTTLIILENRRGEILLQRRPPAGIWGGLWCLPAEDELRLPDNCGEAPAPRTRRHAFTHFELEIRVRHLRTGDSGPNELIEDDRNRAWVSPRRALDLGLPRPVRTLITELSGEHA